MRKYRYNASSQDRIAYAQDLMAGLQYFPETAGLASMLAEATDRLNAARLAREQAEEGLNTLRARLRFADYGWGQAIRALARTAEIADGSRRGLLFDSLLPEGVVALVSPKGEAQVSTARQAIDRLRNSRAPRVDEVRGEWLPRLEKCFEDLQAALQARDELYRRVADARSAEMATREDHERTLEKVMGAVRTALPGDRARWNVIFPKVARAPRSATLAEGAEESAA